MNSWDEHEVTFASAEGLSKDETSVRVLDHAKTESDRISSIENRAALFSEKKVESVDHYRIRAQISLDVKNDPAYKFLMMVAAFSSRRINKMMKVQQDQAPLCGDSCSINNGQSSLDVDFLNLPEVSGVVHLSAAVYGHMKEAEQIISRCGVSISLKDLVENVKYSTLFARLVAIRMSLTSTVSSSAYRLDGTFRRLHEEQHMVLQAFRRIPCRRQYDWSRPVLNLWK